MLLDHLTDVLAFEQVTEDHFVAHFGNKTATRAERSSDSRLFDNSDVGDDWLLIVGSFSMALGLVVSGSTVGDEFAPMSMHSRFLRIGIPTEPIDIMVTRDGASGRFARRQVRFAQHDREFFASDVCFHRPNPSNGWQLPHVDVAAPDETNSALLLQPMAVMEPRPLAGADTSPMEVQVVPGWFRFPAGVPESPTWCAAAQAWLSDYYVAQALLLESGRSTPPWNAVTLEHMMWFHRRINPADWMLLHMTPISLADDAYLGQGTIHDETGALAATIVQSGIFVTDRAT